MTKRQPKRYGDRVKRMMSEMSRLFSRAQAFSDMGHMEMARPVWSCAISYEKCTYRRRKSHVQEENLTKRPLPMW
jgi:hypothetical protein